MLVLPSAAQIHLARVSRRLTICGLITKNDGSVVRCTQHMDDLEIDSGDFAGIYFAVNAVGASDMKSSTDMSVDNLEITGPLWPGAGMNFVGFTVADIEAGLFRGASFITFLCQWDNPGAWQKILKAGTLGAIKRTAEGQFQAEWRGLFQALQQNVGETYAESCDVADFGDQRCGLTPHQQTGTVTALADRDTFTVGIDGTAQMPGFFNLGKVIFTSGANAGYFKQIKDDTNGGMLPGALSVFEAFPNPVQIGDTVVITEGCDRRFETCQAKDNVVNFRGHGRWIPGIPKIIRAP